MPRKQTARPKPLEQLAPRERQIMDILLRQGRATATEVQEAIGEPLSNSAVRGMLRLLVAKGYAAHEKEIFTEVANARSRLIGAKTPEQAEAAEGAMNSALSRLLVIAERYPDLKANEQFTRLQDELAGTENRITVERMRYNEAVRTYNTRLRRFPTRLFASATGFETCDYFEASSNAQDVPKVDFGTRR